MKARGKVPSPLRYCASCLLTLLFWAVWLVLVAALAVQAYIGVAKDVPVPDFVLRRIEASLAAENFSVRFGGAHFDPGGRLLLENMQLRMRSFEEPVFSSRLVYVRKNIWSVLAGRPVPDEVSFEGATLQLPAIFSPSGTTEPLLRDMTGDIRFEGSQILIDQLAFRVGDMPVTCNGVVTQPRNIHGKPVGAEAMIGRFLQYGRQVALALPDLQAAEHPALNIEAAARPQGGTNLALVFTAEGIHQPASQPVDSGPLTVTGHWAWDGIRPHPFRLHVHAKKLSGPRGIIANDVRGVIQLEPPEMEFAAISAVDARIMAGRVQALGEDWVLPVAEGSYGLRSGAGHFTVAVISHGQSLAAAGDVKAREKTAQIQVDGLVPPGLVTGLLARFGPKLEPYFRFVDPVDLHARAALVAGWRFGGMTSYVQGGRLDSHGVQVTSTRGQIDVDPDWNFLAHDAHVVAGENDARGTYWMNFRTFNYRMLLTGKLRPAEITGWFRGEWWLNFWKNFSFPVAAPQSDVDVQGCWRDASQTSYFGSTDAVKPVVLGADFDRARTRVFLRPQFAHAYDLAVERAGGSQRATGWFIRFGERTGHSDGSSSLDYDLTGNIDFAAFGKMGGEKAATLLAPFRFDQAPQLHLAGHTDLSEGKAVNKLRFTGESHGGVQYSGFPLEGLSVDGGMDDDEFRLDRVDFLFAGGHGNLKATLNGPTEARRFSLEGGLKDADMVAAIRAVEDLATAKTGTAHTSISENKIIKRANGGKLDLTIAAQGDPADLSNMRGNGAAQLAGAELGEIHLFGALSKVLSAVALNFSSLKLDTARTSFQIGDGRVHFPDVRITGPSAMIEAKGDYQIAGKSLDFTAKLKPYEESHNPLTAVASMVITPFTSIFELKLTGPIAKPSWSVVLGQGPKLEAPAAAPGAVSGPPSPAAPETVPEPAKKPAPTPGENSSK